MPSITFWNRIEPRPRTTSIARSLSAPIRDPMWMLTRQWQFGEFNGVDAGSPAFATIQTSTTPLQTWRPKAGADNPIDGTAPLESLVATEAFTPNLTLRTELGFYFEDLLAAANPGTVIDDFRRAYPLASDHTDPYDLDSVRFRSILSERVTDGYSLFLAASASAPNLPPAPAVDPTKQQIVKTALVKFLAWVRDVYGQLGAADPPAWAPERLEYQLDAIAPLSDGGQAVFAANPDRDAEFDWYTFDLTARSSHASSVQSATVINKKSLLPSHVRFRGMPNARWWDFESGTVDFGALDTDRREITKLLMMDFMLVHGNDWFVIPLDVGVNSLTHIDWLSIRDTFGTDIFVPPPAVSTVPGERWTMFAHTDLTGEQPVLDGLMLPPSAASATQRSTPIEDVRFIRDEIANMVWAIERTVEGETGAPLDGAEREAASLPADASAPPSPGPDAPPIRYEIQTRVPQYWIPFLPVKIDPANAAIALERAAMLRTPGNTPILPSGRILTPQKLGSNPYRVREEDVDRTGTRVSRTFCRARWMDGSTHLWVARRRQIGRGEGSSGLKFDSANANA
jgi:hypothetical protein